jgi:hypothetical protein
VPAARDLERRLRDVDGFPLPAFSGLGHWRRMRRWTDERARARDFALAHVRPFAERWDQRIGRDAAVRAWPLIDAGVEHHLLGATTGMWGLGAALRAEELAAADAGVAAIFDAHERALARLVAASDAPSARSSIADVVEAERRNRPSLFALARSEPSKSSCRRGPRGTELSASVRSVRNLGLARHLLVVIDTESSSASRETRGFVVPCDAPGVCLGPSVRQLGARACPVADLELRSVLVEERDAVPLQATSARLLDSLDHVRASAVSIGIARGVVERVCSFLAHRQDTDVSPFEEAWVRVGLAAMLDEIDVGRALVLDAALAIERLPRIDPALGGPTVRLPRIASKGVRALHAELAFPAGSVERAEATCSNAASENARAAVRVCARALQLLGEHAGDPRWGVEKCFRDAVHWGAVGASAVSGCFEATVHDRSAGRRGGP